MSEKTKQIPIGEIVRRVNLEGLTQSIVIDLLKENDNYRGKIKDTIFNGTVVEGTDSDRDTIVDFIKSNYDQTDYVQDKGIDSLGARQAIDYLKSKLVSGDEYYEYKTVVLRDSVVQSKIETEYIDNTLNKYALEGWRLKAVTRQEIGANWNTVLFLERVVVVE